MGNHRFMPFSMASKSWFSKLKHIVVKAHGSQPLKNPMEKKTPVQSPTQQEDFLQKRASQYIPSEERKENPPRCPINTKASDTHFPADLPPPRKSKRRPRKVAAKPCTGAANSSCKSEAITPKKIKELEVTDAATSGCKYEATRSKLEAATSSCKPEVAPELKQLPPILTKAPALKKKEAANSTPGDESETARRRSVSVPGTHRIRVRRSSPRIESKKPQYASKLALQKNKKKKNRTTGLSESLVMIKSSSNPWRDFADSMLEMIVENDIRGAKDLEELLACYLSLNSKEYHEVIIKVFEHIWFALTDVRIM